MIFLAGKRLGKTDGTGVWKWSGIPTRNHHNPIHACLGISRSYNDQDAWVIKAIQRSRYRLFQWPLKRAMIALTLCEFSKNPG